MSTLCNIRHDMLLRLHQQMQDISAGPLLSAGAASRPVRSGSAKSLFQQQLAAGGMIEWLSAGRGAGAELVALLCQREWAHRGKTWVIVDPQREFYPPAAWGWGWPVDQLCVVHPKTAAEAWWAVEQSLACEGVASTWFWCEQAPDRLLRRWKLAAEQGGGVGMLFRPLAVARQPAWADVRWRIEPLMTETATAALSSVEVPCCEMPCCWRAEVLFQRGGFGGSAVTIEVQHAAGDVCVVSEMGDSARLPSINAAG